MGLCGVCPAVGRGPCLAAFEAEEHPSRSTLATLVGEWSLDWAQLGCSVALTAAVSAAQVSRQGWPGQCSCGSTFGTVHHFTWAYLVSKAAAKRLVVLSPLPLLCPCAGLASSLSSNVMGAASQVAGLAPSVIAYGEDRAYRIFGATWVADGTAGALRDACTAELTKQPQHLQSVSVETAPCQQVCCLSVHLLPVQA